jgi:mycoredoxin
MSEVKMYTTTWCPDCRNAKSFLNSRGIAYTEINVDDDPSAAELVKTINDGKRKVPTFVVGDDAFHNSPFSLQLMEEKFGK